MPVKNTGMSSLNELFAMKKNLAYETKFKEKLSGMTKDYYHKKENMTQDIQAVYDDLKNIKSSTGYSLDKAGSEKGVGGVPRRPTLPSIYLPPIGVRLVKKYMGIDVNSIPVNRHPVLEEGSPRQQENLESIMNRTLGLKDEETLKCVLLPKKSKLPIADKVILFEKENVREHADVIENIDSNFIRGPENPSKPSTGGEIPMGTKNITKTDQMQDEYDGKLLSTSSVEQNNYEACITVKSDTIEANNEKTCYVVEETEPKNNQGVNKQPNEENGETFVLGTGYNLLERRSSRSTYRGRSSARLPSSSSFLSEYNLEVVARAKQKTNSNKENQAHEKEKISNFYLDYGDGILHDIMEIPRVKDCARPWCNPFCKTCRNRTFSRPCFVLIPAAENARKRQIPLDKRRLSKFPIYHASLDKGNEKNEAIKSEPTDEVKGEDELAENIDIGDNTNVVQKQAESTIGEKLDDDNNNDNKYDKMPLLSALSTRRKGYNKKRIEELSQPRGGPPAEVRFSKWSLRKRQEELVEDERRKTLTEIERLNLLNIQGRISMFLALLNEKEALGKPLKMVDIPMRMDVDSKNVRKDKKVRRKRRRTVQFSPIAKL